MSTYIFDQAWQGELDRLRGLEATFDASTTQRLGNARALTHMAGAVRPGGWVVVEDIWPLRTRRVVPERQPSAA